jgi:hypothetical protein
LAQVDPKPTLTAAGHGSPVALTLTGDGPVAKGGARAQVIEEMPMLPLILSSDSHVFEPPDLWQTRIGPGGRRAPTHTASATARRFTGSRACPREGGDGMLPSDFLGRNVVLSFQEDAIGIRLRDVIGPTT